MSAAQKVEQVLLAHGPSGFVNSREGWVGCDCGAHLPIPGGLDSDGYADTDEERAVRAAHVAEQIVAAFGEPTVEYGVLWDGYGTEMTGGFKSREDAERLCRPFNGVPAVLVTRTVLTGEWQEADQ